MGLTGTDASPTVALTDGLATIYGCVRLAREVDGAVETEEDGL